MPDYLTLAGFAALVLGVAALSPPWALIVGGLLVLAAGLYGRFKGGPANAA